MVPGGGRERGIRNLFLPLSTNPDLRSRGALVLCGERLSFARASTLISRPVAPTNIFATSSRLARARRDAPPGRAQWGRGRLRPRTPMVTAPALLTENPAPTVPPGSRLGAAVRRARMRGVHTRGPGARETCSPRIGMSGAGAGVETGEGCLLSRSWGATGREVRRDARSLSSIM